MNVKVVRSDSIYNKRMFRSSLRTGIIYSLTGFRFFRFMLLVPLIELLLDFFLPLARIVVKKHRNHRERKADGW